MTSRHPDWHAGSDDACRESLEGPMYTITRDQRRADRERTLNRRAERRAKYVPAIVTTGDYITAVTA